MINFLSWLIPQPTLIYTRLQRLWDYTQFFDLNKLDDISIVESDSNYVVFQFESSLGTVQIKLENNLCYTSSIDMSYANYAGTTVFEIRASKFDTLVLPMLGEDLTAHDIDLAIYEIEDYLFINLPDLDEHKEEIFIEKRRLDKLHKEQVKELENA